MIENQTLTIDQLEAGETYRNCRFLPCEMNQADFSETKLAQVDFSTSEFEILYFSPQLMKGAVISQYQAVQMMAMMGVKIR